MTTPKAFSLFTQPDLLTQRGPLSNAPFFVCKCSRADRKWQDQTRMSSTGWGGTCPGAASLQGPLTTMMLSQLSSSTIGLTHRGAASWFTWNNTELPNGLAALTAVSIKMELFALKFPSSPHPNSGTPAGIELEPVTITSQMQDGTDRLRTEWNGVQPRRGPQIGICNGVQNSRCPGNIRKIYIGCSHPHKPEVGEGTHGAGPFRAVLCNNSCAANLWYGHLTYL